MSLPMAGQEQPMINPRSDFPSNASSSKLRPSVTIYNVFDGSSTHLSTSTLLLTTIQPSTTTISGTTRTISAITAVISDHSIHAFPADGCWDDPKCWYSKTHSEPTVAPTANAIVKGYDGSIQPSAERFLKDSWPYFAAGLGGVVLFVALVLGAWFWSRGRKQKRRARERKRQIKRISSGANSVDRERNGNVEAPIELGEMGEPRSAGEHERDEEYSPAPDPGAWFGGRGGV